MTPLEKALATYQETGHFQLWNTTLTLSELITLTEATRQPGKNHTHPLQQIRLCLEAPTASQPSQSEPLTRVLANLSAWREPGKTQKSADYS